MKTRFLLTFLCGILILTACQPADINAPAPNYDTGISSDSWVTIPAGEFLSGQFNHETMIDYDFDIMVTTVTNEQYADYLNKAVADGTVKIVENEIVGFYEGDAYNAGRHEERIDAGDYIHIPLADPSLRIAYDGKTFSALDPWGNHPVTMVSWFGAKAYCEYYDWRLPEELEWEKAARGTDGRPFPWGETILRRNANLTTSGDPFEDMGAFGSRTTPVGFYNGNSYDGYQTIDSPSPYGVYDMAGNVWQWTANIYDQQHYRYLRGGSKDMYESNLRVWVRNNVTPTYVSPAIGFRCIR